MVENAAAHTQAREHASIVYQSQKVIKVRHVRTEKRLYVNEVKVKVNEKKTRLRKNDSE